MDLQQQYDELENIVATLTSLISELTDEAYIDELDLIKIRAEDEQLAIQEILDDEFNKEEKEMQRQYDNERI